MSRPPRARQPLKEAALELFVTQGVHATGIREIAKKAGCSEAALYRHWSNKEDLVTSLFREHIGEVVALLEQSLAGCKDLPSQLLAAATALYQLYDDQPLVFRFVLLVRHEQARFLAPEVRMPQDLVAGLIGQHVPDERRAVVLSAAALGIFLQTAEYVVYGRLPGPLAAYAPDVARSIGRLVAG